MDRYTYKPYDSSLIIVFIISFYNYNITYTI